MAIRSRVDDFILRRLVNYNIHAVRKRVALFGIN